jgi:hypothetical protein
LRSVSTLRAILTSMKIRLSELRRLVREAAKAVYGWPTDEVEHVYDVPDRMADTHPIDMGNLRLPKGPNSRDDADDRPLSDELPGKPRAASYGERRGVGHNNKSNNDNGRGGGGGG